MRFMERLPNGINALNELRKSVEMITLKQPSKQKHGYGNKLTSEHRYTGWLPETTADFQPDYYKCSTITRLSQYMCNSIAVYFSAIGTGTFFRI